MIEEDNRRAREHETSMMNLMFKLIQPNQPHRNQIPLQPHKINNGYRTTHMNHTYPAHFNTSSSHNRNPETIPQTPDRQSISFNTSNFQYSIFHSNLPAHNPPSRERNLIKTPTTNRQEKHCQFTSHI